MGASRFFPVPCRPSALLLSPPPPPRSHRFFTLQGARPGEAEHEGQRVPLVISDKYIHLMIAKDVSRLPLAFHPVPSHKAGLSQHFLPSQKSPAGNALNDLTIRYLRSCFNSGSGWGTVKVHFLSSPFFLLSGNNGCLPTRNPRRTCCRTSVRLQTTTCSFSFPSSKEVITVLVAFRPSRFWKLLGSLCPCPLQRSPEERRSKTLRHDCSLCSKENTS